MVFKGPVNYNQFSLGDQLYITYLTSARSNLYRFFSPLREQDQFRSGQLDFLWVYFCNRVK